MPLKVIETYFPDQNCLVYLGKLEGAVAEKRQLFRGKVADIPKLHKNKRFNLRIRGTDQEGNRYHPLLCHARTDGAGDLYVHDRYAPVIQVVKERVEPDIPVMPKPTELALEINKMTRSPA